MAEKETLKKLYIALKKAKNKVSQLEATQHEPIAIIGMACRLPGGANNPDKYWEILKNGIDTITDVPANRWDRAAYYDPDPEAPGKMYTTKGGFLDIPIDGFDASFFKISPKEAQSLDPQQRLLLEISWEALENANINITTLEKSQTSVFLGISGDDYVQSHRHSGNHDNINAYSITGSIFSTAAGRLSYFYGFEGPCFAIDTACSSSLVALHLACKSLRLRESELALVGGVNLMLTPETHIGFSKLQALSPDGYCKTFDASADGYVRGEGSAMLVLKRLSDALNEGDKIFAIVKGSAINQDGKSSGLTAPNGLAQQKVIREALDDASLSAADISYIEAHGTGTPLGDPIEIEAIGKIIKDNHTFDSPLLVGSAKTNIGHTEPVAGLAGIIKVVQSLQHEAIPPHLHFKQPTPHISWDELPIKVPTQLTAWPRSDKARVAGISSFGFSGTNAHVIIAEAPSIPNQESEQIEIPHHILTLSAKHKNALSELVSSYVNYLSSNKIKISACVADICYTASIGRCHFKQNRLAVVGESKEEIKQKLSEYLNDNTTDSVSKSFETDNPNTSNIAFLFTGQGSQYVGMGHELYETQPTFRKTIDHCDELLRDSLDTPLLELLYSDNNSQLNETAYTQPALFALEYALAKLWQSWGIKPSIVMGHSVGEYVAACIAGVFSLEDGLKLVAARGRLMQTLCDKGDMLVLSVNETKAKEIIQAYAEDVSIAAINGSENVVISGKPEAIKNIQANIEKNIRAKLLPVSHAFHSPMMEPMLAEFERIASEVTYAKPKIPLCSNVTGQLATEKIATPEYWVSHVRQPVRFAASMETLYQQGSNVFVEIGPKPALLGMGRLCLAENGEIWLPSLRQGQNDWQQILQSLGELYVGGVSVDWVGFDKDYPRNLVILPTYPFQRRKRYWIDTKPKVALNLENTNSLIQQLKQSEQLSEAEIKLLPRLLDILAKQSQQQVTTDSIKDWLYEIEWQVKPHQSAASLEFVGRWLIFADQGGLGQALAKVLENSGVHCILVYAGNLPTNEIFNLEINNIVHLWSLDSALSNDLTLPALEKAQELSCGSVLNLVQTLSLQKQSVLPRLWLVTRGAVPIGQHPLNIAQSPLWGLGKVVALEHPEFWGGMLDLSPDATEDETVLLLEEIHNSQGEDHIAFRDGQRYVARLVAKKNEISTAVQLSADYTYLITGGLGALGLRLAQWMIAQGVRNLVLTGRRGVSSKTQEETLKQLEQAGAKVLVATADVANQEDMIRVFAEIKDEMPPLRGIIHAAGIARYQTIKEMDFATLKSVLRPKVLGAYVLHQLTQEMELDFFVSFSSIASVWGSKGQGHYAAANHFLDVLAHYRQLSSLPALSINWGPWAEGGMVSAEFKNLLTRMGVKVLPPELAINALDYLLGTNLVQTTVVDVDWRLFKAVYELTGQKSLLAKIEVLPQDDVATLGQKSDILEKLESAQQSDYHAILETYLQDKVAKVLGLPPSKKLSSHQGLFDMGMDSLMAVELKNQLNASFGVSLPTTLAIEYPSINAMTAYLLKDILYFNQEYKDKQTDSKDKFELSQVEQLSDDESAAFIDNELADLLGDRK